MALNKLDAQVTEKAKKATEKFNEEAKKALNSVLSTEKRLAIAKQKLIRTKQANENATKAIIENGKNDPKLLTAKNNAQGKARTAERKLSREETNTRQAFYKAKNFDITAKQIKEAKESEEKVATTIQKIFRGNLVRKKQPK